MKVCKDCGVKKPVNEFYKSNNGVAERLYPYCKECAMERNRVIRLKSAKDSKNYYQYKKGETKVCKICGENKPTTEYYLNSYKKGLISYCKECHRNKCKEQRDKSKEGIKKNKVGRPTINIPSLDELKNYLDEDIKNDIIANEYGVSGKTLWTWFKHYGIEREKGGKSLEFNGEKRYTINA